MRPRDVTNAEQARAIVEERQLEHVKVGVFDMDGILRGKYMAKEKFFSQKRRGGFVGTIIVWGGRAGPLESSVLVRDVGVHVACA